MFASLWQGTARHYLGVEATLAAHWGCSLFRGTGVSYSPQKITAGRVMDNLIMADVIPATFFNSPVHWTRLTDTFENHGAILKNNNCHLCCITVICSHFYHISVCIFCKFFSPTIIIMYYQVQFTPCQPKGEVEHGRIWQIPPLYLCKYSTRHFLVCTCAWLPCTDASARPHLCNYSTRQFLVPVLDLHVYSHLCKISILVQLWFEGEEMQLKEQVKWRCGF